MKKIRNKNYLRIALAGAMMVTLGSFKLQAQSFPISIASNPGDVYVESMDVGLDGDIYVTGRIENWTGINFGIDPINCGGFNVLESQATSGMRIFVARLHPDDGIASGNHIVWMTVGYSSSGGSVDDFMSKDIEVSAEGEVFITGSLQGNVQFERVIPAGAVIGTCGDPVVRHFVCRMDLNGNPLWVAEASHASSYKSHGEGITLDEENERLFTGGYVQNGGILPAVFPLDFRSGDCTYNCVQPFDITYSEPSPTSAGFITEYKFNGVMLRAQEIGSEVTALDMDPTGDLYITGARHNGSGGDNVLLTKVYSSYPTPCVADYSTEYTNIQGDGDDRGLDIAYTSDGRLALVGAFTNEVVVNEFPLTTITAGGTTKSELFVAVFDGILTPVYYNIKTTTSYGVVSANYDHFRNRTACIAADPNLSGNNVIMAYDVTVNTLSGELISRQLTTTLNQIDEVHAQVTLPPPCGSCPPYVFNTARAMEIEYGLGGGYDDRYLSGDHRGNIWFGGCKAQGSGYTSHGYTSRINSNHNVYHKQKPSSIEEADENQDGEMVIYPNPTEGNVVVQFIQHDGDQPTVVKIYDLKGREVYRNTLRGAPGLNKEVLELSLESGSYLFRLEQGKDFLKIEKLVIIK